MRFARLLRRDHWVSASLAHDLALPGASKEAHAAAPWLLLLGLHLRVVLGLLLHLDALGILLVLHHVPLGWGLIWLEGPPEKARITNLLVHLSKRIWIGKVDHQLRISKR